MNVKPKLLVGPALWQKALVVVGALALGASLGGCSIIDLATQSQRQTEDADAKAERESRPAPRAEGSTTEGSATSGSNTESGNAAGNQAGTTNSTCQNGAARRTMLLNGPQPTGVWVGDIVEPHGAQYRLRAVINDDGCDISGTFEYQGLNCSGRWVDAKVIALSEGANVPSSISVNFREEVDVDPGGVCAPVAQVSMLYGPGGMFYSSGWVRSDGEATSTKTHLDPG